MAVNGDSLYAVNRFTPTIDSYELSDAHPQAKSVCDEKCSKQIKNPFDIAYDSKTGTLLVLDASYHPVLPTYVFSIKSINVAPSADSKPANDYEDIRTTKLRRFYANWFASLKKLNANVSNSAKFTR